MLSFIIVFSVCSLSFESFASSDTNGDTLGEIYFLDTGENGTDHRFVDKDGNEMPKTSPAVKQNRLAKAKASSSLPSSYDSRDAGLITSVKSQGSTGCCWAFSTMAALESDAVSKSYMTLDEANFSEAHLVWFAYNSTTDESNRTYGDYHSISSSPYLYGGNWSVSSSTLATLTGIATESDYPFSSSASAMGNYEESERYNHESGLIIDGAIQLTSASEIKSWIMEHGACTMSIMYDSTYEYNSSYYNPDFDSENDSTNHMITAVGWDDDYDVSNFSSDNTPSSNGAWLIKDSWGTRQHTKGYYWLSYEDTSLDSENITGFTVREDTDIYNNYSYNGINYDSSISFGSQSAIANIFTADGYEQLTTIGYQTIQEYQNITVQVYNNVSDSNPVSGTLVTTEQISQSNTGYHTYDLETPVNIYPGMNFSIVLTYENQDGSDAWFPCERNYDDYTYSQYSCSAGQSFLRYGSWYDVLDFNSSVRNVYISAFTKCVHQYDEITTAATCVDDGIVKNVCSQCGYTTTVQVIPATGSHDWGEWSEYEETNSNYIISTSVCQTCGAVRSRKIYDGHNTVTLQELISMIFRRVFALFGITIE